MLGVGLIYRRNYIQELEQGLWKAALVTNTRRAVADDDRGQRMDFVGGKENSEDIAAYERVQEKYERNGRHCLERALRCL